MSRGSSDSARAWVQLFVFGGAILLLIIRNWHLGRIRRAVDRGDDLPAIAKVLNGDIARDPTFPRPFVRYTAEGIRSYCHQRLLNNTQGVVITALESKAGFPGFLQATTSDGIRHPMRSTRFRSIESAAGFRIVTTDTKWASEILAAGLQAILVDLRRLTGKGSRVQLGGDRILLEVEDRVAPDRIAPLQALVQRLCALARRSADGTGIAFEGDIVFIEQSRCPVCSQACTEPGPRCGACQAPHHADCWDYWGRCAIFGCGGTWKA